MPTPNQPGLSAESNAKVDAIIREFKDEKARERSDERARSRPRRGGSVLRLAIVSVAALTVWIGPEYIALTPTALPDELIEKGVKTNLFLEGLQLQSYRAQHGQLPIDLAQAGVDNGKAVYVRRSDSTFSLTTTVNGEAVSVTSEDNVDSALVGLPMARVR